MQVSVHSSPKHLVQSSEEVDEPMPKETDYEIEPPKIVLPCVPII